MANIIFPAHIEDCRPGNLLLLMRLFFSYSNWVKRVLIIGSAGAGKSILAAKLGGITNLPVIHLDQHFWQKGWVMPDREDWMKRVRELTSKDEWIMDGNFDSSLEIRLPRADTLIYLDFPRSICFWRIIKRIITNFGRVRPDMAEGCREKLDLPFIRWVWNFRRDIRPGIEDSILEHFHGHYFIRLKKPVEVAKFLRRIRTDG